MSIMCKFSKQVILVKGVDILSAKQWAYAFLNRLDQIEWGFWKELITNKNLKFLSKFWTVLFAKLGVKLFYRMAYHPQIIGASE